MRNYDKLINLSNEMMLRKLKANTHKKGFDNLSIDYLMQRINDEHLELKMAYSHLKFNKENILNKKNEVVDMIYEAADVMNFCAMLIYNLNEEIKK